MKGGIIEVNIQFDGLCSVLPDRAAKVDTTYTFLFLTSPTFLLNVPKINNKEEILFTREPAFMGNALISIMSHLYNIITFNCGLIQAKRGNRYDVSVSLWYHFQVKCNGKQKI